MLPNEILLAYLAALSAIIDLISGEHYKRPIEYDPNPCGDVVLSSNGSSLTWHESIEGVCCNCPRFMRIAELCTRGKPNSTFCIPVSDEIISNCGNNPSIESVIVLGVIVVLLAVIVILACFFHDKFVLDDSLSDEDGDDPLSDKRGDCIVYIEEGDEDDNAEDDASLTDDENKEVVFDSTDKLIARWQRSSV